MLLLGIHSLQKLSEYEADDIAEIVADKLGTTCWKNSPQSKKAINASIKANQVALNGVREEAKVGRPAGGDDDDAGEGWEQKRLLSRDGLTVLLGRRRRGRKGGERFNQERVRRTFG